MDWTRAPYIWLLKMPLSRLLNTTTLGQTTLRKKTFCQIINSFLY